MKVWIALALCLCGCSPAGGQAQQAAPSPAASSAPSVLASSSPLAPLVGGYTQQDPTSENSLAMLKQAEGLLRAKHPDMDLRLTELISIQSQVVAGSNYRIHAKHTDRLGKGQVVLVLFRSLQNEFSLSESDYAP